MAKIPKEELDRLKTEIDLILLIQSKGVVLEKNGSDFKGLCPFHSEKSPSFVVTPSKHLWHCFGCNQGGTAIDFVMKSEKVSFRCAVELLQEKNFNSLSPNIRQSRPSQTKLNPVLEKTKDEETLLLDTVNYYHERIFKNPTALEYLEFRGLNNQSLIKKFKLGFSDRTLGLRLPIKQVSDGKEIRKSLQELGILRQSGHEHFRGNITIPIFDEKNKIVSEIYGRRVGPIPRKQTSKHLYLPRSHKGIFNPECLTHPSKEIYLCEAIIDSLSLYQMGFRNTTSSFGTNGFTDEMLSLFLKHQIKRVYIFYDADKAGDEATKTLSNLLTSEGIECLRPKLPNSFDINDFYKKMPNPKEEIQRLINLAKPLFDTNTKVLPARALLNNTLAAKEKSILENQNLITRADTQTPIETQPLGTKKESPISKLEIPCKIEGEDIFISLGSRLYRIRGLKKNLSYDVLRINIRVSSNDLFHLDTFDLYHARNRSTFILASSKEIGIDEEVIKRDLGRVLLKLEELQDQQIQEVLKPKEEENIKINDKDKKEVLAFLKSKNLIDRILKDFKTCGMIGEETNKLVGYLASISRKLDEPLAVIIQSSSSAGKTSLMEAILAFMPKEDKIKYSAMTGQSLFYMGETNLKHKILAIVEEEGAEKASYALKLLQSEGELMIASTGKDGTTGRMITHEYKVEGPVMIFLTTTAMDIDEEFLNRCIVLSVNETREQTKAIHNLQRQSQTILGLLKKRSRKEIYDLHHNAQRLLRPLLVANPYANKLTFLSDRTRTRRDHLKYLTLIRTITLLHQYQREIKKITHEGKVHEYIEVEISDIELANKISHEVLGRSLSELPPQTKKLLIMIFEFVQKFIIKEGIRQEDFHFTRKQIREYTGWSDSQLKTHIRRLEDLEYLITYKTKMGGLHRYELLYKGEDQEQNKFVLGLLEPSSLVAKNELYSDKSLKNNDYDSNWSGQKIDQNPRSLGQVCPKSGGCLGDSNQDLERLEGDIFPNIEKMYIRGLEKLDSSYIKVHHS